MAGKAGISGETFVISKKDGEKPVVKEDGRKKKTSNRAKHLKRMTIKPLECNDCPYGAVENGGNGVCTQYKADSVCTVRKDLEKVSTELDTRDPDLLKARLDLTLTNLLGEVDVHMKMCKASNIPPNKDLLSALKLALDGMKIMGEFQRKTVTREITETEVLTDDQITQISRTIREHRNEATD